MHTLITILAVFAVMVQTEVTLQRGDIVRIKSENAPLVRIVAVAGDRVRIDDSGVFVNGAAVTSISPELLSKPWEPEIIPAGHYLVAGEERSESVSGVSVSRYWALIGANKVEKVQP